MEAFLAVAWQFRVLGIAQSTIALDVVEQLESLFLRVHALPLGTAMIIVQLMVASLLIGILACGHMYIHKGIDSVTSCC